MYDLFYGFIVYYVFNFHILSTHYNQYVEYDFRRNYNKIKSTEVSRKLRTRPVNTKKGTTVSSNLVSKHIAIIKFNFFYDLTIIIN